MARRGARVVVRRVVALGIVVLALSLPLSSSCKPHEAKIEVGAGERSLSWSEQREAQAVADRAVRDVRALLPSIPESITLVIVRGTDVIPETGENATTVPPAEIVWTVHPARDLAALVRAQLRPTLFHELHHLARRTRVENRTLMDEVVSEGMATAFERDFGGVDPPWGKPPAEAAEWTRELSSQPPDAPRDRWLVRHPDGRRWIGMRAGTFVVDRAAKASGRTPADLVHASTDEVLALAGVR